MSAKNKYWTSLRSLVGSTAKQGRTIDLMTGVVLPVIIAVLVNIWTAASADQAWIPGSVLLVVVGLHAILFGIGWFSSKGYPAECMADALELEVKAKQLQAELTRRTAAYRMVRSAFDMLNLQTCQMNPTTHDAFAKGLNPVIEKIACNIRTTFGVTSNQFSIEVYCVERAILDARGGPGRMCWKQVYLYSPQTIDPLTYCHLGARSPGAWAFGRGTAGILRIADDKHQYYEHGEPAANLYFRMAAASPISEACQTNQIGFIVLTSMQTEAFAEDVLDMLGFVGSLVSQYLASHNRCVVEYVERSRMAQVASAKQMTHQVADVKKLTNTVEDEDGKQPSPSTLSG